MSPIKKVPIKDIKRLAAIAGNAYPGFDMNKPDVKENVRKRLIHLSKTDKKSCTFGLYRKAKLIAGIRYMDFIMNMFGQKVKVGGGGMLAVDLIRKKEHSAKEIVEHFISFYKKRKYAMLSLYPFRPDFYHKMGFGYGSKVNCYIFKPGDLPSGDKSHIEYLNNKDAKEIIACYNRYADSQHGMFRWTTQNEGIYSRKTNYLIGYRKGKQVKGCVVFTFDKDKAANYLLTDMIISVMIWENRDVFAELMAFLRSQSDQIGKIRYSVQDDSLGFVPRDPRNHTMNLVRVVCHETNVQGVGIMYRVINMPLFFENMKNHNFGGETLKLKINIEDSFLPANGGAHYVEFKNGTALYKSRIKHDVEIAMDIAEFSSMIIGVVDFKDLYRIGKADISDEKLLPKVNGIFHSDTKPMTLTQF